MRSKDILTEIVSANKYKYGLFDLWTFYDGDVVAGSGRNVLGPF